MEIIIIIIKQRINKYHDETNVDELYYDNIWYI
jgi:hypothetical protein